MTLGHVYDLDLKKNETIIKEVIIQAQGEVRKTILFLKNVLSPTYIVGARGVHQDGQGDMDELHIRPRQLSEQMSPNQVELFRLSLYT